MPPRRSPRLRRPEPPPLPWDVLRRICSECAARERIMTLRRLSTTWAAVVADVGIPKLLLRVEQSQQRGRARWTEDGGCLEVRSARWRIHKNFLHYVRPRRFDVVVEGDYVDQMTQMTYGSRAKLICDAFGGLVGCVETLCLRGEAFGIDALDFERALGMLSASVTTLACDLPMVHWASTLSCTLSLRNLVTLVLQTQSLDGGKDDWRYEEAYVQLSILALLPALRELSLNDDGEELEEVEADNAMLGLSRLTQLRVLHVTFLSMVGQSNSYALGQLFSRLTALEELDWLYFSRGCVWEEVLEQGGAPNLRRLRLKSVESPPEDLRAMVSAVCTAFPRLEQLAFEDLDLDCHADELVDLFAPLGQHPSLRRADLTASGYTDEFEADSGDLDVKALQDAVGQRLRVSSTGFKDSVTGTDTVFTFSRQRLTDLGIGGATS